MANRNNKKYDWEKWFEMSSFGIKRGIHYFCSSLAMAQQVRNAASRRCLTVSIGETGDGLLITVTGMSDHQAVTRSYTRNQPTYAAVLKKLADEARE